MGLVVRIVLHIAIMFKVWWDPITLKQMFNHDKTYPELFIENYLLGKITQPCQNNLQMF